MMRPSMIAATTALLLVLAGCGVPREQSAPSVSSSSPSSLVGPFSEIAAPAGAAAGQPHIAAVDGGFLMSWTEPAGAAHALRIARYESGEWSEERTVAERDDFFVNWADFPSVAMSGNTIFAHWLQRSAPGTYNYDVVVSISTDGGSTWGVPFVVHDDGVKAEHGFASMVPMPDNRVGITWLDGREMGEGHDGAHGDMSLRYAVLTSDGSVSDEAVLDDRTCECCTTAIVSTPHGPLVAWRDRSDAEVRDISVARLENGTWTAPAPLHEDGWLIEGCPVNGPQADARGSRVAIAWFTGANDHGRVKVAFSGNGGATFDAPIEIASADGTVGYVDLLVIAEDRAFVIWMEDREESLDLLGREVTPDGELTETVVIASTTRGRTGFPRMAQSEGEILLAWNEKGDSPRIHVARAAISR